MDTAAALATLQSQLLQDMESKHGPLIGGQSLATGLGYTNLAALRQARRRGHVAVALFTLPNRRGYFALTRDVALWLAGVRMTATGAPPQKGDPAT